MEKSLDRKLLRLREDPSRPDFILADAKDADMAYGLAAPGKSPEHHAHEARFRSLAEYRQCMREIVAQGLVDIMLMSASSNEILTIRERIFDDSPVTPAVRANDTTDIWLATGTGRYAQQPSLPFRTATIDHIMCGKAECRPEERHLGADLGLYSVTFNNDAELDRQTLEAYKEFRLEAERKGFRHFLEVFDPNAPGEHAPQDVARFINDHIVRTLAGVTSGARPLFLKIPYHGPAAIEALVHYDPTLLVGILGGSAGTTYDAFYMLWEAKKFGARAALYGRKINNAEHQLTFVYYLRLIADDKIAPDEAVRAYHSDLKKLGIRPHRSLEDDLKLTQTGTAYSAAGAARSSPTRPTSQAEVSPRKLGWEDQPDFSKMTPAEKARWNIERWKRIIG
ncbi:MAG: hypothetical protein NZ899_14620 [Thermoguttaceae bacterium]|nr:hypothetical protein [Thermoguttaceae bacterium]MDW8079064.1 hypothetical protein [Thermoguttaceae bacterium]